VGGEGEDKQWIIIKNDENCDCPALYDNISLIVLVEGP
jgi:hypothetical protein